MTKSLTVEVEVPHGLAAGDRFAVLVEPATGPVVVPTWISDIPVEQMTDEQLKRERTNARSMLYKATRKGKEDTMFIATVRLNKVAAEIAKRKGTTLYQEVNAPAGLFEDEDVS